MHEYLLYSRCFENATWILTEKHSGNKKEYNRNEMSKMVIEGYVSSHNRRYSEAYYGVPKISSEGIIVRYLHERGGLIAEIRKSIVVSTFFSEILPDYEIDCYGFRYHCPKCYFIFDDIKLQGEESEPLFCVKCFEYVDV